MAIDGACDKTQNSLSAEKQRVSTLNSLANAGHANPKQSKNWEEVAQTAFDHPNADHARQELSRSLGVSAESLQRIGVGALDGSRGWTMPERNGTGMVIGINRRFPSGTSRRECGCMPGLTFDPERWREFEDVPDLYLVDGAIETAAMLTMGLTAIGRPSNLGGGDLLAELLNGFNRDRRIVVVGAQDRKTHESMPPATQARHKTDCTGCSVCWPGWYGAVRTAEQLARLLNRETSWTLVPEGFQEIRDWMNNCNKAERRT